MKKFLWAFTLLSFIAPAAAQDISNPQTNQSALTANKGQLPGTTTNNSATAGNVGEYKSSLATNGTTSGSAIISVAAPGIVTWASHGLNVGSPVNFTTSGTLPTGATAATNFYVCSASLTANSFAFSTTVANALAGTCVTTTGSTSGTQNVFANVILSNAAALDITALSLTAGDWDVQGFCAEAPGSGTTSSQLICTVGTALNTIVLAASDGQSFAFSQAALGANSGEAITTYTARISLSATTTYHLVMQSSFAVAGMGGYGIIRARRAR